MMLGLTLGLGVWQLERLAWKQALLADIDRGNAAPAVPLPANPVAFMRVLVRGEFLPGAARYGAEVRSTRDGPVMGSHVLGAIGRADSLPVIVDRGWAPADVLPAAPSGPVTVEGYVRSPEHTPWLGAADDSAHQRFFALDPIGIGQSLGLPEVAPFTVVALGAAGPIPEPAQQMPTPPNDHLSYAITWFSLSLALVVVFVVFAGQTLKA